MAPEGITRIVCLSVLLASLCQPGSVVAAEKNSRYWTTNYEDASACERQLNMIYGALQEYQRRNQNLPHWLSELVPDFIHDPNTLVCPFVRKTGNLKKWREKYFLGRVFGDPGPCSYGYEFCTVAWFVPGWTTRTYKERQMELVGLGVPIVRCLAHHPILNLGLDGSIYSSPGEWEDIFVRYSGQKPVLHNPYLLTNISENKLISKLNEPRKPETDVRMLDLSTYYNAALLHLSQIDHSGKLLATYPEGVQTISGVDFDVRGLVHLNARQFPISFPEKIDNIPLNRKCASIHFLHGAVFTAADGSKVSSFIVHFRDGHTAEVPVIYGRDVRTRWFDSSDEAQPGNPKPAWITPSDSVGTTGKSLRLYMNSWKNQQPDSEVASVAFVSYMTESAPFLLAITAE